MEHRRPIHYAPAAALLPSVRQGGAQAGMPLRRLRAPAAAALAARTAPMPPPPAAASLRILQSGGGSRRAPSQLTAPPPPEAHPRRALVADRAAAAGSPPAALSPWRGRPEPPCTAPTRASNVDGAGGASGSSSSSFVEEGDGNNLSSRWTQLVACSPSTPTLDHVGGGCCSSASAPGACSTTPTRPPSSLQHRQANASETSAPQLPPRHLPRP